MLENKKVNLVISFILAFALWFYVVGQMNPPTKKTYRDIPIMLVNEQTLYDNSLAVLSRSDDSMRVTVSGRRDVINKLSKADIVATVDLSDAAEGNNKLSIDLKIPENVEIDNQSINDITVNVEERITKTKDIRVQYTGTFESDAEPATVKLDPETVKVSGAKSIVEKVSFVKASVDAEVLSEELGSATSTLTAVTSGGSPVNGVTLSRDKCKITSIIYNTKTVKLVVPVKDDSKDNYTRHVSYPKSITVKGPASDLSEIVEVTAAEIDITDLKENKKILIVPELPDNVDVADKDKSLAVTVKVSKSKGKASKEKETKTFTFTEDDVEIRNSENEAYAVKAESLEVQITGTSEQLSKIKSSDIVLFVDLKSHTEETFEIDITAECSRTYSEIAVIPSKATIITE